MRCQTAPSNRHVLDWTPLLPPVSPPNRITSRRTASNTTPARETAGGFGGSMSTKAGCSGSQVELHPSCCNGFASSQRSFATGASSTRRTGSTKPLPHVSFDLHAYEQPSPIVELL